MKTLITIVLCFAITGAVFAQAVHPPLDAPPPTKQVSGGIALMIVCGVATSFVIYAFWTPGPRWQTLVLLERSRLTGDERAIATNTVWMSGKAWPYAFTIIATNAF